MNNKSGKTSAANIQLKTRRADDWGRDDSMGFLDTEAFASYCLRIRDVIHANPKGLWIAGIHRALKDAAQPRLMRSEALRA